jgi:preprotein translocase subunit SecY
MSLAQRTPPSSPEFMQRLVVTLAALAVYRLGAYVPLAGINPTRLASLYRDSPLLASLGSAGERFSVVGLGVTPIVSVLLLLECARLLSPRFNVWAGATPNNTRRLERYAFVAAVLLATVQPTALPLDSRQSPISSPSRVSASVPALSRRWSRAPHC